MDCISVKMVHFQRFKENRALAHPADIIKLSSCLGLISVRIGQWIH